MGVVLDSNLIRSPEGVTACATCGSRSCAYAVKPICKQKSAVMIQ